jgi:peptidoglycan/xylan/chitin deacetylase (PgdA/CDA1 family)/glycosyltransferase involved in cell wall biosynthesis
MQILHLLSQYVVTGAETYAATLADKQLQAGNKVYILSDTFHTKTEADYKPFPLGKRNFLQRIKNIIHLVFYIRKNQITIVHAHSRAASWVAFFACKFTQTPLVSTLHGRQHIHKSSQSFDMYGNQLITVCENNKTHLVTELNINPKKITVIPNGFDFDTTQKSKTRKEPHFYTISIIGRSAGPKGERTAKIIKEVIPDLIQKNAFVKFNVIGGNISDFGAELISEVEKQNLLFGSRINLIGHVNNVSEQILKSDLIIAAGRVAIESLALQIPVFALGEAQYLGLITKKNIDQIMASNFGDMASNLKDFEFNIQQLHTDLDTFIQNYQNFTQNIELSNYIRQIYAIDTVMEAISQVYKKAILQHAYPSPVPILMYHKVPDADLDSRHKTYVSKKNLNKHFFFFKIFGFTPITFKEYNAVGEGKISRIKKPLVLTFDDGYADNYDNLFPLLRKFNFKCVIYVLGQRHQTNFWDVAEGEKQEKLMNESQIKSLHQFGIEIGAHTLNHIKLNLTEQQTAANEIIKSKENLEHLIQEEVISFAYPYGLAEEAHFLMVKKAGFKYAVLTDSGAHKIEDDPFRIFRINMFPHENYFSLWKKTSSWYRNYYNKKRGIKAQNIHTFY